METFDIYLASASPRRRELLTQIGVRYRLLSVAVNETLRDEESPEAYVQRLALDKALAGRDSLQHEDPHPVLGADTAVVVDDTILGKPENRQQGLVMLQKLAGREHQVLTGVALVNHTQQSVLSVSRVTFRSLSQGERERYWATGECLDKAGAYAIQGYGAAFVRELRGSYSGVMGLPLYETSELLSQAGVSLFYQSDQDAT